MIGEKMKIFYSWQSDTANNVNRSFIKKAADDAIKLIKEENQLEEADRESDNIELDQDTQGILGSPPIADTIFRKIKEATIVLADVTLTGSTPRGKKQINSNVAIELGFAIGIHGDEVLLKIMNTYYGLKDDLPFDLKHRRWPLTYELDPQCTSGDKKTARTKLTKQLVDIFREYLKQKPTQGLKEFSPTPSTFSPSAFWKNGEELVSADSSYQRPSMSFRDGVIMYLRIWPENNILPLSTKTLNDYAISSIRPLEGYSFGGYSYVRNRFGIITHSSNNDAGEILAFTQLFKTGEIWGASSYMLRDRAEENDTNRNRFIPSIAFENELRETLYLYLQRARENFGYGKVINVEAGISNAKGLTMALGNHYFWGPIFDEHVNISVCIENETDKARDVALLKIFEGIFDAIGTERPDNYGGFPTIELQ